MRLFSNQDAKRELRRLRHLTLQRNCHWQRRRAWFPRFITDETGATVLIMVGTPYERRFHVLDGGGGVWVYRLHAD